MATLTEKVALVTGGAQGIGYAIGSTLARHGARLVLADMNADGCRAAQEQLRSAGAQVVAVAGNVAVVQDVEAMVGAAITAFGRLDILVNNAGGSAQTPLRIEDVTEEHFDRVMAWNVRGTFFCSKAALPHLKARGGSIINMASISGRGGTELVSPQYSAAKAAIIGMTRNLARHLGPHGIRVNAIAPGFIKSSPRVEAIWRTRNEAEVLKTVPLGRRGEMDDIAQAALFLASDASGYVTGAVLDVNGGFFAL
ncbi:MAG: SDR family oxidoreductase [Candidatus Rokubacteria bacterium]|nr:SDR family oxidoreductase [Candidatus Rokubacteria bacterium]